MNKPAPKEPSMDEILSSIRQIIADDDAGAPKVAVPPAPAGAAEAPSSPAPSYSFPPDQTTPLPLSTEQIARLTQVDYEREMALLAVRPDGTTVGVARLVREMDTGEAEFAVVVQGDAKGNGVASALMRHLLAWGRAKGVREVVGQVLADNAPMLAFIRKLGFKVRRTPGDADVLAARLALTPPPAA